MQEAQQTQSKSLFEVLGLNSSERDENHLLARRVVVVGDALSGKRTLVSRLFAAAVQQFPSSCVLLLSPIADGSENFPPYSQTTTDLNEGTRGNRDSSCGISVKPSGIVSPSCPPYDAAASSRSKAEIDGKRAPHFPHGVGIAHSFIFQRLPAGRASLVGSMDDCSSNTSGNSGGPSMFSATGSAAHSILTEYFCCDAPGALATALPTVLTLETSVVLVVVDGSSPWTLHEQIRRWYGHLKGHVAQLLRGELPKQDEVRRVRMTEQQKNFWATQEQVLGLLRNAWCEREGGVAKELVPPSSVVGDVCPLRTLIVCSKTDELEKLSRELEKSVRVSGEAVGGDTSLDADTPLRRTENQTSSRQTQAPWVTESLRSALCTGGLTLLQLVGQLLRKEAIERRSGLVGTGSSVNTTTTATSSSSVEQPQHCCKQEFLLPTSKAITTKGRVEATTGLNADGSPLAATLAGSYSTFVHPFYKSLWSFLFQVLYEFQTLHNRIGSTSALDAQSRRASQFTDSDCSDRAVRKPLVLAGDIDWHISALFHPYTFLPHGVDHVSLLNPLVASTEAINLQSIFGELGEEGVGCCGDITERRSCDESVPLRGDYMRKIETLLAANTVSTERTA
ncbi:hypothetical protein, conserved [Trypanosoma brucei gambiense DAL972]|uniref:Dynein light intermediate chain n=1 Tax=Trypanosoma brucei gambiense (strain MHOM/CI/86/DAL972) TaxID=679716 RepID=D0A9A0_TRYB9|nr:hypothetical protein, conserved [Trypanosoma brucei gambiense DAL972]CBH18251.1 hypothetical protein, conserved [Trypanosoma brucei gambiense DAL972]|eukprot:XP_011780515.1 hypothetical protein, conserved [Trypanosoma brucei gambiense DAL972]